MEKARPQLVLTGFGHFPGVPVNPTQTLLDHFRQHPELLPQPHELHLLDVAYRSAGTSIAHFLDPAPSALILTGYSGKATAVTLEAQATSYCAPDQPDICNFVPMPEENPGPDLPSNSPLDLLCGRLSDEGIAAEISQDAGGYLCNYTYRQALARVQQRQLSTKVLFVHLPALEGTDLAHDAAGTITMQNAVRALSLIARELAG